VFDYCEIEKKICPFCAKRETGIFCGIATGINRIEWMKKCPLPDIKRRTKGNRKKHGL
jgi:hypothetical protein